MEIIIALAIFGIAGYVIYRNISKKNNSGCNCGSCSSHCPQYKDIKK